MKKKNPHIVWTLTFFLGPFLWLNNQWSHNLHGQSQVLTGMNPIFAIHADGKGVGSGGELRVEHYGDINEVFINEGFIQYPGQINSSNKDHLLQYSLYPSLADKGTPLFLHAEFDLSWYIYGLNGTLISFGTHTSDQDSQIDLSSIPQGVYIIVIEKVNSKISVSQKITRL